jgi:hypothetical protein
MEPEQRIKRRNHLLNHLEYLISESVYYRTNSSLMSSKNKIVICNINNKENKKKIL